MTTYSVGDTAYGSFGQYSRIDVRVGIVTKVTPSGQTVVAFPRREIRFTPNGREVGAGPYSVARLIDAGDYARLIEHQKVQDARADVRNAIGKVRDTSLDDIDAVIAALATAAAAAVVYKELSV